ncbi:ribose import ATP-binding protein RbsA [Spirochaetia bacterium]|nr:ribose import ATP-binding protein RbsA [Spirochaetia bacterium]
MSQILSVEGLTKQFPGVKAVDDLSFSLNEGEMLAILGENGAGKSTLTKMICGAHKPTSGRILLDGKERTFNTPYAAMQAGIAMVYQELSTTGDMSVAENVFMNRQMVNALGIIKKKELYAETQKYLDMFHVDALPQTMLKRLSAGEQQKIEIAKAISMHPKVLVLDEPTSSLAEDDIERLFSVIDDLKKEGFSFIYISHKLSEIFRLADRVLVMRDGKHIGTKNIDEVTEQELITMMVGREITDLYADSETNIKIGEKYFEVDGLASTGLFNDISFSVKKGEIVGMAGLVGAGRTEVASGIIGMVKTSKGSVRIEGKECKIRRPIDASNAGIGYITEDRKKIGLFLEFAIKENVISASLDRFTKSGFISEGAVDRFANEQIGVFNIAATSSRQKVMNLSGGNQQKCLLATWMSKNPKVLIFDEPTRGVDVGAKSEIYENIRKYVQGGCGALIISSEMQELIGICDRILVMYQGRIVGEVQKEDFSEELILSYASGLYLEQKGA